jgi:photosystem II stability/assembly factor-like uncharacterized protein
MRFGLGLIPLLLLLVPVTAGGAVPLTPVSAAPAGPGGGGAMFWPAISPHDPKLMFVSCDMNGFYRSEDSGQTWTMIDGRQMHGTYRPDSHVMFLPRDPNTMYAYGYARGAGALRVSHDRGKNWAPFVPNPPWGKAVVTEMAFDPDAAAFMLAGTEDGAFRSGDSGKTWARCERVDGKLIGLFVDPTSSPARRRCFAATPGGVFRSEDGGRSWQEASAGLPWRDLRHFAAGADRTRRQVTLYVTLPSKAVNGQFGGGVYRSTDSGQTWESAMGAGINTTLGKKDEYGDGDIAEYNWLGVALDQPDVVYVTAAGTGYWPPYHSTVYKSVDAGRTWQYVFNGDPRYRELNLSLGWITWDLGWGFGGLPWGFAVCASNADIAAYTNSGECYLTTDGGKNWRAVYTARAAGQGAPGPGQRWQSVGVEVTTCWHYVIDPHHPAVHYICYTDVGLSRSEDGGKTWRFSAQGSPWKNSFYELAIDPDVSGRIWAAASNQHDIPHWTQLGGPSQPGGVVRSDDGGKTWRASSAGLPKAAAVSIVLDPHSPRQRRRLWVSVYGYGVFRSDDGGGTWIEKSAGLGYPGNRNVYRLDLRPDGTLFCSITGKRSGNRYGAPGGIWRSRDGGETWEGVTESLKPIWMLDYAVNDRNPRILYLCTGTTPSQGRGALYKTTDGGRTWRKLPLDVTAGNSADSSEVEMFAPALHPLNPDIVFVTTTGHGTWLSKDGGATWAEFKAIPFLVTHHLTFDPRDPRTLYMTTFGGGVWKVTLR